MRFKSEVVEMSKGMKLAAIALYLILVGFGVYVLFHHNFIIVLFFAALTARGLFMLLRYFLMRERRNGWDMIGGIINIAIGLIMFLGSDDTQLLGIRLVELLVAMWAIINGVTNILGSFVLKKQGIKLWTILLALGIISFACGAVIVFVPLLATNVVTTVISVFMGIALIMGGLLGLTSALSGREAYADAQDIVE
ncbi:MAG: DUF308 domain-containing protein [Lachnospiraceae bacterium]|nr:DUF308 domain-containing protein [Lachnospiraceae bacterium]